MGEQGRLTRPRATRVRFMASVHPRRAAGHEQTSVRGDVGTAVVIACSFLGLVAVLALVGITPFWAPVLYGVLSIVLFAAYGADKSAAQHDRWRTSEETLHLLALAGGWPGALVAQQLFRHKTTKQPFQGVFWGTVVGNCVLHAVVIVASSAAHG